MGERVDLAPGTRPKRSGAPRSKNRASLERLFSEQGGKCFICQRKCLPVGSPEGKQRTPTREHLIPLSAQGTDDDVVMCCHLCNHVKGDFIIPRFLWRDPEELRLLFMNGSCKYGKRPNIFVRPDAPNVGSQLWTKAQILEARASSTS